MKTKQIEVENIKILRAMYYQDTKDKHIGLSIVLGLVAVIIGLCLFFNTILSSTLFTWVVVICLYCGVIGVCNLFFYLKSKNISVNNLDKYLDGKRKALVDERTELEEEIKEIEEEENTLQQISIDVVIATRR